MEVLCVNYVCSYASQDTYVTKELTYDFLNVIPNRLRRSENMGAEEIAP
jgi:hypothetical protein